MSCQIQSFLSSHPGEVVLLDFQHFHGLTSYDHTALKSLLRQIFTTALAPIMHSPTLAYLARYKYQVGRQLIVHFLHTYIPFSYIHNNSNKLVDLYRARCKSVA